ISLEDYAPDLKSAKMLEKFLHLKVYYLTIKTDEAISVIPEIIKVLKSFDPAIPNDITVYFGLKFAKKLGLKSIMTGDGSDEILAGYDFMKEMKNLDNYIKRISKNMYFSSNKLGNFFGIEIKQPYMDKQFVNFALSIDKNFKIRKEKNKIFGKWILRKAFENGLPDDVIWQNKRPLEVGSGMTKLREIISDKISDEEFIKKQKIYSVKFINKEHLYYYKIYRDVVGKIPKPKKDEKSCNGCGAGMKKNSFHCKICGYVLISDKRG
ncbi:MAG: asparagine synthase-related protein, partial [Elusimicrobiota bacterium]|nr:asparagine synthase-related protein [Elusimicrobiota bacterium]